MSNKICKNCVMDNTDPSIKFDSDGICSHCNNYFSKTLPKWKKLLSNKKGLTKLRDYIKSRSSKESEYDCIIGLSGGIDSSYLLHLVVNELSLKPLVFHVDAGWNSNIANNNIEKLVDNLKLDLYTEVINWKEMRDLQLSFLKSGVSHIDAPQDYAFFATLYEYACKFKIKTILTGGNFSTECVRNPIEWMYFQSDNKQLRTIHKKFGNQKLRDFPRTHILWHKFYLPYFKGIKIIKPLNYFEYNKQKAKNLLIDKYEWKPYPQKHFESRFTSFYEGYWLFYRFGFDVRKVQLSSLILTNQLSRNEALTILSKPPLDEKTINLEKQFVADKLRINLNELEMFFKLPLKTYKDYKNDAWLYKLGSKFLKLVGKEIGGKI